MLSRATLRLPLRSGLHAPVNTRLAIPTPIARNVGLWAILTRDYSKKIRSHKESSQNQSQFSKGRPKTEHNTGAIPSEFEKKWTEPVPSSNKKPSEPSEPEEVPLDQLPDLTRGIPSTLEFETSAKDPNALTTTEQPSGGGRKKGELPASAYVSSGERRRLQWARYMYIFVFSMGAASVVYLGRDWETEEEVRRFSDAPNGLSLGAWWKRARVRSTDWLTYYQEPSFDKLLPDPDPSFARPYTLVLSLEDLLIHSDWSREHGWRIGKRPGVDYFLRYLSQYYEIVLFTSVPFAMGEPAVRKLDPYHFIMWPLFREATKYNDGEWIKDLSYLNRDLSKVIMIDTKHSHVSAQPENAIVLPKWKGERKDSNLVALIPFLEYIHTMQFPDVRRVLKSFEGKHIPSEFARREAIARQEFEKELAQGRKGHQKGMPSGLGFIGSLLGMKPSNMSMMQVPEGEENPQEAFSKGKMLQDIARERGQRNYQLLEEQIRENGEKWLKEEQEMMDKAQKEAMSNMKSSFSTWFTGPKDA